MKKDVYQLIKDAFWIVLTLVFILPTANAQNNTLVIDGAYIVLEGGDAQNPLYLVIDNGASQGIVRNNGHIVSENQYNYVKWNIDVNSGNYVIPFGVGGNANDYIPFTFNKTSANSSFLQMSTWATNMQNMPKPAATNVNAVTNMSGSTDSVIYAIDRFWDIRAANNTLADLTFSYRGVENTAGNPLQYVSAQHWNGSSWDPAVQSPSQGVTAGIGTAGPYTGQSSFSPWVLVIQESCPSDVMAYQFNNYCIDDSSLYIPAHTNDTLNGSYTVSPIGLSINPSTGEIEPSTSAPGNYTVTYTVPAVGFCPQIVVTSTIEIIDLPNTPNIVQTGNILSANLLQGQTAQWFFNGSPIGTGSTIVMIADGFYECIITNKAGCSSSLSGSFKVNPNNTPSGIDENDLENLLTIYPNPTYNNVNIKLEGNDKLEEIVVFDALGKNVYQVSSDMNNEKTIDLSTFSKGVYLFKIKTQNGFAIKKVIKK